MEGIILFIKKDATLDNALTRKTKNVSIRLNKLNYNVSARRFDDINEFREFYASINEDYDTGICDDDYDDNIYGFSDKIAEWYCPNCSQGLAQIKDTNGNATIVCPNCGTKNFIKQLTRHSFQIDLRYPRHSAAGF